MTRSWSIVFMKNGAGERIRTSDPLFTNSAAIEFSSDFSLSMYSRRVYLVLKNLLGWLQNWLQ